MNYNMDLYQELELDEFLEYIDVLEEEMHVERVRKRYIRDAENPMEFFNANEFRALYRFHKNTVANTILPLVLEGLQKPTNRGLPIPPILQLLVCLRFYATCNFQVVSGDLQGISQSTISVIIKRVSVLIAEQLGNFIHFPRTLEGLHKNKLRFSEVACFPNVVGCIGCTHIKISSPGGNNTEVFRNRKGFFSLNVQVVSGPNGEIMDIVVRHPGSNHNNVIFDRSSIRVRMERGEFPGLLIGDNGYACKHYLLTPVIQAGNEQEERYNRAHKRTRDIVERLFVTWKRRFPCLQRGLRTKLRTSLAIICATAVLHNIGLRDNDDFEENVVDEVPAVRNANDEERGLDFRGHFIQQHFGH